MTRPLAALAVAAVITLPLAAAELTVNNVKLGTVLHGPPVEEDQLRGSVVFVEEWGIH
jgi:hypothetical protein